MSTALPISVSTRRMAPVTATAGMRQITFNFPVMRETDVRLLRTRAGGTVELTYGTDFTVWGVNEPEGGTVTLATGALAGDVYVVEGDAGLDRLASVTANGRFSSAQIDRDFDLALIRDQELRRDVNDVSQALATAGVPVPGGQPVPHSHTVNDLPIASQPVAQLGISNTALMTPFSTAVFEKASRQARGIWVPGDVAGYSDDVGAFEQVIAAASPRDVIQLVDDYDFTRTLLLSKPNLTFRRSRGVINQKTSLQDAFFILRSATDTTLDGLHLNGNKATFPNGNSGFACFSDRLTAIDLVCWDTPGTALLLDGSLENVYTGNGSSTVFGAGYPLGNANDVIVRLNGVGQSPLTAYTVSGNNVVFASPPAAGVAILLKAKTFRQGHYVRNFQSFNSHISGISQWNVIYGRFEGLQIEDAGLEALTTDINSDHNQVLNSVFLRACQSGGVGGWGIDQCAAVAARNVQVLNTASGLPGVCVVGEAGNSTELDLHVICRSGTGDGIYLRRRPRIYPATTGETTSTSRVKLDGIIGQNAGASIRLETGVTDVRIADTMIIDSPVVDGGIRTQGEVSGVKRPFFEAARTSNIVNVTGNGAQFQIPFNSVQSDPHGSYNSSTGVFTAPFAGLWQLSAGVRTFGGTAPDWGEIIITTTQRERRTNSEYTDESIQTFHLSATFYMARGDTASVRVRVGGDASLTVGIEGDPTSTWFVGSLIRSNE